MNRFEKLAYLNTLANESLADNDFVSASKFHNEFIRVAQINQEEAKKANGPEMQKATMALQAILGVGQDGLFGPSTAYAIVKALDGISPEPTLDKSYVQRAREYVQSLPVNFVNVLKNFVGMKDAIRELEKVPATRPTELEPSNVKIRLLQALAGYKG